MKYLTLLFCLFFIACGHETTVDNGCTIVDNQDGTAILTCEDGSNYTVENGKDGKDGSTGNTGSEGPKGSDGGQGQEGPQGDTGSKGQEGDDAESCTVVQNNDGTATISCPDGTEATISVIHHCFRSFYDVACEEWYFDYVEQLVDDGVLTAGGNFRPADNVNRAELTEVVIRAIDGLPGYIPPPSPTFYDVPEGSPYYDYIEAANQLGIISGYTDASGNLTGYFGPEDDVSRAAGAKIIVNGFSIPTLLTPASPFSDVTPSDWYHNYVLTAYNWSVVDGIGSNTFHPSDTLNRAQMSKWVFNAQSLILRDP